MGRDGPHLITQNFLVKSRKIFSSFHCSSQLLEVWEAEEGVLGEREGVFDILSLIQTALNH